MLASTAIGAARGALDAYLDMTAGRKTRGALAGGNLRMAEFATVQLRVAEAAAAVEAAQLILLTDMREATEKLRAGGEITIADRIRARRNQAYVTRLAVQAVEPADDVEVGVGADRRFDARAGGPLGAQDGSEPQWLVGAHAGARIARI